MDEGTTALLEGPPQPEPEAEKKKKPIIQDTEELLKIRREVRKIDYGDYVKLLDKDGKPVGEKATVSLPKSEQDLRTRLDEKFKSTVVNDNEEEEHRKHVPDISLRQLDENGWEKLKWGEKDRKKVVDELERVLNIEHSQAKQAMFMLVAKGETPQTALAKLESRSLDYYKSSKGQEDIKKTFGEEVPLGSPKYHKYHYLVDKLGITNQDYIKRFVLDEEFRAELDNEYDQQLPQNLFDLAWNMGYRKPQDFGMDGKTPVLQMQVGTNPETGKWEGRYVVNQANVMHWLRGQMWEWYEVFDTQEATDYFSKVQIHKGQYATINLITMLFDVDRYWRDETGHKWDRLYNQVLLEPWMLYFLRTYKVEYDKVSGDDDKLVEGYKNLFHLNKLTMKIYGKSMFEILTTLPEDFEGVDSDTKVGESWLKMFLAYYNLADFEELKNVLGEDSPFFTREGWITAAEEISEDTFKRRHMPEMGDFFGDRQRDEWENAFDKEGKVTDDTKENFLKFINIYNTEHPSNNIHLTLDRVLKDSVSSLTLTKEGNLDSPEVKTSEGELNRDIVTADGKIADKTSLNYAWLIADAWTHFSGALARGNFPNVSGHFAETKWLYTDAYRDKYMGFGGAGTFSAVPMFKQTSLPFLEGILLENSFMPYVSTYKEDKNGKKVPVIERRQMVPMEVFKMMNAGSNEREAERRELREKYMQAKDDPAQQAAILQKIEEVDEDAKNKQKMRAGQLEFNEGAMRVYSKNLVGRGAELYKQLMSGEETAFDKFTSYDGMFRGPSFNRADWQAALQSKYITPLRYLFDANGATQLNMKQRFPLMVGRNDEGKPIWEWKTMYVGERMLGHQVLDIPEFRKQRSDVSDKKWEKMKDAGYKKKGKYIVRPDGRYDINYNRVQADKPMVYKQFMLMKLAADLWQHIDRHSTDPGYSLEHYESIIAAIEELPGNIDADEFNMQDARVTKPFFSHEQMQWLRKVSGSKKKVRQEFMKTYFIGDPRKKESGLSESTSIILNAIFRGY